MTIDQARSAEVPAARSIPVFYRMLLRGQLTRGRIAGLSVMSLLAVVLAFVARSAEDADQAGVDVLTAYGFGLLVPLAALMLATPMLGNLIEDGLLVYLWLKPVPRWHLAVAALAAVVSALVPVVVVPVTLSAVIAGGSSLVGPSIIASVFGVLAYAAIYLFLGARFSWGLWLGLVYLVLWENVMSRLGDGMARLSIRSYMLSMLDWGTDQEIDGGGRATVAAIIVPLAVAAVATALTAWTLQTRDID